MTLGLSRDPRLYALGKMQTVKGGDLQDASLRSGNPVTVWREKVPDDKRAWWGHGGFTEQNVPSVYQRGTIVNTASGANIDGTLHVAITDSDGDPLYREPVNDLESLRDMASESRTERDEQVAHSPGANPGRYLELQIEADDSSDGDVIDSAASTLRQYYSTA